MTDQQLPAWAVRIRRERLARGWGPFKTARRMYAAVGIDHPDTSQVKHLARQNNRHEKGEVFPADWGHAYAIVFELTEKELFGQESIDQAMGTVSGSHAPDDRDHDVKRRAALRLFTATSAGTAVPAGVMEEIFSGVDRALDHTVNVDEWDQAVHEYGQRITARSAGALIQNLVADVITVGQLLERTHVPSDRAGLMRVSAGLSGLLAVELDDVGDDRAARISWNIARRAADASGNRDVRVWIRGRAAQAGYRVERSDQAVINLTDEAIRIADGRPSAGLARAHAARACLAAERGDGEGALAAIEKTRETFETLPQGTDGQTTLSFSESQLLGAETFVFVHLGDKRASAALEHALALYPPKAQTSITSLQMMRAASLVKARDIDSGLQHAVTVIQDRRDAVKAGTRLLARQILHMLPDQARALPAARELRALMSAAPAPKGL
ncbi:XRE family transcriptional regulator [Actinomadura graeca]|uniref:XRE family transcriptional regulator n=1 Tax=Actinomadura graeca TaxID=2750812 RepID=A0ABX8QTW3_9ACTN|nr:XRE family transcriptional regulator [Actinomadura graeca]QXJ21634.1 XRE family transcriptional regulator [Actinomadura graeca]